MFPYKSFALWEKYFYQKQFFFHLHSTYFTWRTPFYTLQLTMDPSGLKYAHLWHQHITTLSKLEITWYIELSHSIVLLQLLEVYQQSINEFMEVLVTRAREHEAKTEAYEYAKEMAILAKLREAEELVV